MDQLTKIASSLVAFINNIAVPLIFAVAFIVFLFGVFRYFIAGAANPEKRKEGTQLILYSVIGFAVMISVWGLVNLVVGTLGFTNNTRPALPAFSNTSGNTTGTSNSAPTSGGQPTNLLPTTNNPNAAGKSCVTAADCSDSESCWDGTCTATASTGNGSPSYDPTSGLPPLY